ncbi:MAG: XRE family transcriptional regulator [Sphingomonadaceae bacterium]|nr:XRE family transcriptional regulator [Sphingomonadaceae bacterium]
MTMAVRNVTRAEGNIFADLGLSNPGERQAKARLVAVMLRSMRELGLNQTAAARRMGIPQPKLSNMLRGRMEGVSEAKIAECLRMLGHDVDYKVGKRHEGVGQARVLEGA